MKPLQSTPVFWGETWTLAFQALRANKLRAMLTMLGVIIGSGCIVLVVTVALAGKRYIISVIEGVGSNLVLAEAINPGESRPLMLADEINTADLDAVKSGIPQVIQAAGTNDIRASLFLNGVEHPINLVGVTPGFAEIRRLVMVKGRYFDEDDLMSRSKVCVITEPLASILFPDDDPVGRNLATDEGAEFAECSGVKKSVDARAGVQLALAAVLVESLRPTHAPCVPTATLEIVERLLPILGFSHAYVLLHGRFVARLEEQGHILDCLL